MARTLIPTSILCILTSHPTVQPQKAASYSPQMRWLSRSMLIFADRSMYLGNPLLQRWFYRHSVSSMPLWLVLSDYISRQDDQALYLAERETVTSSGCLWYLAWIQRRSFPCTLLFRWQFSHSLSMTCLPSGSKVLGDEGKSLHPVTRIQREPNN